MFPRFRISRIETTGAVGSVTATHYGQQRWVEDQVHSFLLSDRRVIFGRWYAKQGCWIFSPEVATAIHALAPGSEWDILDCYWGERAEIVLDQHRGWTRTRFVPSEAQRFDSQGQSAGEGIWDHEHCALCWKTIDDHSPEAYVDDQDEWLCTDCYVRFVLPRSLDFIPSPEE
jgi:hypothetical protein